MLYADCTGRSSEIGNLPDASTFEVAPRKFLRRLRIARPQTGIRLFYLVRPVLEVVCDAGIVERSGVVRRMRNASWKASSARSCWLSDRYEKPRFSQLS